MASVTIYTKPYCPYCHDAKALLAQKGIAYDEIDIAARPAERDVMIRRSGGRSTVPQIFIGSQHIGGCDDIYDLDARGGLDSMLSG